MEFVDVVVREQVDVALHARGVDPRAGHVDHHAAVCVAGGVVDRAAPDHRAHGDPLPGIDLRGQQAEELLQAVEYAAGGRGVDAYVVGSDLERIAFGGEEAVGRGIRVFERQDDGAVAGDFAAYGVPEVFGGILCQGLQGLVGGDGRSGLEDERPRAGMRLPGCGLGHSAADRSAKEREKQENSEFHGWYV